MDILVTGGTGVLGRVVGAGQRDRGDLFGRLVVMRSTNSWWSVVARSTRSGLCIDRSAHSRRPARHLTPRWYSRPITGGQITAAAPVASLDALTSTCDGWPANSRGSHGSRAGPGLAAATPRRSPEYRRSAASAWPILLPVLGSVIVPVSRHFTDDAGTTVAQALRSGRRTAKMYAYYESA